VLLTTPESLHLMLAQKEYPKIFQSLQVLVVDEWHELLGTKRGVQVELGLSRLKALALVGSSEFAVCMVFIYSANLKLLTANRQLLTVNFIQFIPIFNSPPVMWYHY